MYSVVCMLTASPITYAVYISFLIASFKAFTHLPTITISNA